MFGKEFLRPCQDAVAVLLACQGFDLWDKGWFGVEWQSAQWRRQYDSPVERVRMLSHQYKAVDLVPADLTSEPDRRRKRPYIPSANNPRTCWQCGQVGHYGANCRNPRMGMIVERKKKATAKAVRAIIDLTDDE